MRPYNSMQNAQFWKEPQHMRSKGCLRAFINMHGFEWQKREGEAGHFTKTQQSKH